jgi:hypothetical protein
MKKIVIITFLLFSIVAPLYAGGGWTQKKGKGFIKLNQWWVRSSKYYNRESNIIDITTTGVYVSSLYMEYGITDRLTAIAYTPFFVRSTLNKREDASGNQLSDGDQLNGFGDLDLAIKYGLLQNKKIVLSVGLQVGIPSGNPSGGNSKLLQTGDGEFNQMLTLDASHSFYPIPLYVSTQVALNNRTNNFSDEFRYGIETGYTIKQLTVIIRLNGVKSFFNGDDSAVSGNGIFNNNVEFIAYSGELIYAPNEKFGISVGAASALQGRQILANRTYNAGVFIKI